jgi:hypothetical protein
LYETLKVGVFVEDPRPVRGFDMVFCHIKNVLGKSRPPIPSIYNVLSCFGDNKAAQSIPNQVAMSKKGTATRNNKSYHFIWDWMCPTNEEYQNRVYNSIESASDAGAAGVHIYCIGFPREEFCTCPRCSEMKKASGLDWSEWRAEIVTDFVRNAKAKVNVPLSLLLPKEPYALRERMGIDVTAVEKFVDFFIDILYDKVYSTTYWLEDLAFSMRRQTKKPLYVQLYAGPPQAPVRNLFNAIVTAAPYCDGVLLFTGSEDVEKLQKDMISDEFCWKLAENSDNKGPYNILKKWSALQ